MAKPPYSPGRAFFNRGFRAYHHAFANLYAGESADRDFAKARVNFRQVEEWCWDPILRLKAAVWAACSAIGQHNAEGIAESMELARELASRSTVRQFFVLKSMVETADSFSRVGERRAAAMARDVIQHLRAVSPQVVSDFEKAEQNDIEARLGRFFGSQFSDPDVGG